MTISRRTFLWTGSAGGAGLLIGFNLYGCGDSNKGGPSKGSEASKAPAGPVQEHQVTAWVRIGTDDSVTMIVPESEMGQGVLTSVAMVLAEELDADWTKVRSEHAPVDDKAFGRQSTGGSTTIRKGIGNFRRAGAIARGMLVAAAAQQWGVKPEDCTVVKGVIESGGHSTTFGAVAEAAAVLEPSSNVELKDPKQFKIIGTAVKRLDIPGKVDGTVKFGMDVQVEGMLTAQVAHPPFGGKLASFDGAEAKRVPGVVDVIAIPTGVAVVAEHFWAAKQGRDKLKVEWDGGKWSKLSTKSISAMCKKIVGKGKQARSDGDARKFVKQAKNKLKAVYQVPYLAHATMEPMNATADVRADACEVWCGTQSPTGARNAAAKITGLDEDKVKIHNMMLGGGFGRRSQVDFVEDAVHTSKAIGKPVKVVWTREDDMRGGYYRPMAYNELEGAVDDDGWPAAWVHRIASPSILEGFGRPIPGGVDPTSIDGAADLPYAFSNIYVSCAKPELPITLWFWRSVGSSQNAFVTECFFDELAALGGKDPLEARLRLLADEPRHKNVVEVAAEKAGWGSALPEGRARGIALRKSFGTYCAQVAEVSIEDDRPRVHKITVAVDPGQVVNPDTIEAQMQSGITYGLSTMFSQIDIENGWAVQGNFDKYPVVRLPQMPVVDVHIVPSGDKHGGIGEPGLPPAVPAVCNALFKLTGKPIRTMPLKLA